MDNINNSVVATGMGIISSVGIGTDRFGKALREGVTNFSTLEFEQEGRNFVYPAAKASDTDIKSATAALPLDQEMIKKARRFRNLSTSALWGLYCAMEAWKDAGLDTIEIDPQKMALLSGGSNTQRDSLLQTEEKYHKKLPFLNPNYGLNFFDTDLVGTVSELLGIRGEGYSIGGASASGNIALIHAYRLINSGLYDIVMVVAPLMELSVYQYQGFTALGAMAVVGEETDPATLCRPFDVDHRGFVYGQNTGCIVLESEAHARKREKQAYAAITGYGINMDANRNPNPSAEGEKKAMTEAMARAGIDPNAIDYINTHGTASPSGDAAEAEAIVSSGLTNSKANSTKSLIGHGLSAASLVEMIACFIQMKNGFLHPSHNLETPISNDIKWVGSKAEEAAIRYAISNSFGFGGINSSIVLRNINA